MVRKPESLGWCNQPTTRLGCRDFKRLGDPGPFACAAELLLGAITSGAEIENLRVAGIKTECARPPVAVTAHIDGIFVEPDVAVGKALQFLKGDSVRPQKSDMAAIRAQRGLRTIACLDRPFRVMRGRVVPVRQDRAITGVAIKLDQ